jgi:hypothetical protein
MYGNINNLVLKQIKSNYNKENPGISEDIKIPRGISFLKSSNIDCDVIIEMSTKGLTGNMQTDTSAFEGWCFVLLRWTKHYRKICLKWSEPRTTSSLHYQRFLFRVDHMLKRYDWFNIVDDSNEFLNKSIIKTSKEKLVLSAPNNECKKQNQIDIYSPHMSEVKLEAHIYGKPNFLKDLLKMDVIYRQFPVGVFRNKKSAETRIFPSGGAAIDLWGVNREEKQLFIFELKNSKNIKVGAISELFFYTVLLQDLIKESPIFYQVFPKKYFNDRGTEVDFKSISDMTSISAYLLAPALNRLIDHKVIKLMNDRKSLEDERTMKFGLIKLVCGFDKEIQ